MSEFYILADDGALIPTDVEGWAMWFNRADRQIARAEIGNDVIVSTVFLGPDHQFGDGPPLLFETLVIGGALNGEIKRYSTKHEALEGHAAMVLRVQFGNG